MISDVGILMNRMIYLSAFLLFLTSFRYKESDYCKIADQIVNNYVREFATPRGLELYGYGGAMMNDIQKIELDFFCFEALNVDNARILYVEMMEELLNRINRHKKIHPYLHAFPFVEGNIKLMISFIGSKERDIDEGCVALMSIAKEHKVYFAAYDKEKKDYYDLCEESYEEARRKVIGN